MALAGLGFSSCAAVPASSTRCTRSRCCCTRLFNVRSVVSALVVTVPAFTTRCGFAALALYWTRLFNTRCRCTRLCCCCTPSPAHAAAVPALAVAAVAFSSDIYIVPALSVSVPDSLTLATAVPALALTVPTFSTRCHCTRSCYCGARLFNICPCCTCSCYCSTRLLEHGVAVLALCSCCTDLHPLLLVVPTSCKTVALYPLLLWLYPPPRTKGRPTQRTSEEAEPCSRLYRKEVNIKD